MATQTTNLGLTLPIGTEQVSRQVINANMELIDSAIGAVPEGENLQEEIEYVQEHVADLIDDTAGAGDDDKVWSADKTAAEVDKKANAIEMKIATPAAIMSFPDGADGLPMALNVGIEPVQDLHGYDYPWPAGGGKNLYSGDNTVTKDDTAIFAEQELPTYIPAGTYTISALVSLASGVSSARIAFRMQDRTNIVAVNISSGNGQRTSVQVELTADCYLIFFYGTDSTSTKSSATFTDIQIESGSTATEFAPYSNICPISGWTGAKVARTGKNLFDYSSIEDGGLSTYGEETSAENVQRTGFLSCPPNTTLVISNVVNNTPVYFYDKSKAFIRRINSGNVDGATFTTPDDCAYIRFSASTGRMTATTQVEIGTVKTAFVPFGSSDEYPVSWQTEAGTVYGGTLTVNKDGTGTLVVDRGIEDIGNMSWVYKSGSGGYLQSNSLSVNADDDNIICSIYKQDKSASLSAAPDKSILVNAAISRIFVKDSDYSNADDFKTAKTGQKIVYHLDTPVTYTLTAPQIATLLGENNIFADTGDINSVEYSADTKMYIDHLNDPTEDDFIANKNIAANEYFAIGNDLYRATQSIAANDPIVPGTNCEKLSLPEILNSFMTGSGVSF